MKNCSCPTAFVLHLIICMSLCHSVAAVAPAAHDDHVHAPIKVQPAETYRPSAVPDRIVLSWTGDPRTTQSVTWRTDTSVAKGFAEIAVSESGPHFVKKAQRIQAKNVALKSDLSTAHYHTAEFTGLNPGTKYVYRVGDGVNWSEWSSFQTADADNGSFSFIYFGDAQNDVKSHWSRVVRQAFTDAPKARFMLHAGDLINHANRDAEWGEWFYAGGWLNRHIPSIATPGNHEYRKSRLSRHWRPTFAFPLNGPKGLEETAYYLDYQGMRIVSLDSNRMHAEQAKWLDEILTDNPNRWTIITLHHPIYSSAAGRDNSKMRDLFQPVFDKHQVDLVLQGHDHTYARSKQMTYQKNLPTGARMQADGKGTVYVVSVSGPKMYELGQRPFMVRTAEQTQLYQIITVHPDRLEYQASTADGTPYDAFSLIKREGKGNQLVDKIPEASPRRP